MSKLAKQITAVLTKDTKVDLIKNFSGSYSFSGQDFDTLLRKARVSISIGRDVYIKEDVKGQYDQRDMVEALIDCRAAIVEDVFGEFRPILTEMRCALHDADRDRLRKLIAELEHQMFVEGLE